MRVALAAFLSMVTTAAAIGQETTAERLDALEKRVRALEAIIGQQRMPANKIPGGAPAASRATPSAEAGDKGQMLLELTKWSASIKEGEYSVSYDVVRYTLLNNYDKAIKLLDGSIRFFDLAGAPIIEIKLDQHVRIEPGKEVSLRGYRPINQIIDGETRTKALSPEDVRAQLEVKRIMFRDNTIVDLR